MNFSQQAEEFEKHLKEIAKYRKSYLDIIIEKYVNKDSECIIDIRTLKIEKETGSREFRLPIFGSSSEYYCKPARKLIKKLSEECPVSPKKSKYENKKKKPCISTICTKKRGKGNTRSLLKSNKNQKRHIPLNASIGSTNLLCSESITSDDDLAHNKLKNIPISDLSISHNKSIISVENKPLEKSLNVTNSHLHGSKKLEENFILDGIPKSGKDNVSIYSSIAHDDFIYGSKSVNKAGNSSLPLTYFNPSSNDFDISENNSAVPSRNIKPQDKLFSDADLSNPDLNKDTPRKSVSVHRKRIKRDMSLAGNSDNAVANFLEKHTNTTLDERGKGKTCSVLKSNKEQKRHISLTASICSKRLLFSESITSDDDLAHNKLKNVPIRDLSVSHNKSNVISVENKPLEKSLNVTYSHLLLFKKLEKNVILDGISKFEKDNVSINSSIAHDDFFIYGSKSVNKAGNSSLPLTYFNPSSNDFDISENNSAVPPRNIKPQDKLFSDADLSNPDLNKDTPRKSVSVHRKRIKRDMSLAGNSDNAVAKFLEKHANTTLDKIEKGKTCSVLKSNKEQKRHISLTASICSKRLLFSESIMSDNDLAHNTLKDGPISCISSSRNKSNVISVENKPLEKSFNVTYSHLRLTKKCEENFILDGISKFEKDNVSSNSSIAYDDFTKNIDHINVHCRVPLYKLDTKQFNAIRKGVFKLGSNGKPLL